ncbi:glycosyltransferase [Brevibacillus choshinensis]|uniref:glycosyltransferase n=1 Tax=Brevibacillus choshinensis TaxID=54911 RepID=UPI002E2026B9|nr:glycosyltransferase [Brevibacillus choshinensis]MED4780029.1 glycosyltransferase [Brevibacillus choshinensis]
MKRKLHRIIAILLSAALFLPATATKGQEVAEEVEQTEGISSAAVKLREEMRRLWMDQTHWTRNYVVSATAGLEDQSQVLAKLLKNQEDIGNAFKPYYGEAVGDQLTGLLKQHIAIAEKIVVAAKNQQQLDLKMLYTDWYQNADDIANLLSTLNMNWTLNELRDLLHTQLQQVTDVVEARLNKDGNADILAFEQGEENSLVVADTLSEGIIKQFPNQFS